MHGSSALTLARDCAAIQIPSGAPATLAAGTPVFITQSLGGTFTVQAPTLGGLFRVSGADADALGVAPPDAAAGDAAAPSGGHGPVDEQQVWDRLKTCYDPEIPVNIVDLGLVYDLSVAPHTAGGSAVVVKMTLTAPGCGMGTAIAADARYKIQAIPGVKSADVQLVWDPPWSAEMMTEAGRRALGLQ